MVVPKLQEVYAKVYICTGFKDNFVQLQVSTFAFTPLAVGQCPEVSHYTMAITWLRITRYCYDDDLVEDGDVELI